MPKTYVVAFILAASAMILSQSCGDENDKTNSSRHGESKSHLSGYACMHCHDPNRQSKTKFTVAGTILNEARSAVQPKAVIKLYTEAKGEGEFIATIRTDELGNFFTDKQIDFKAGLYPVLLGTPGVKEDTKYMAQRIFNGNCNGCHGPAAERLGID